MYQLSQQFASITDLEVSGRRMRLTHTEVFAEGKPLHHPQHLFKVQASSPE
eukprot:SAG22_NODE_4349_length_1294_cov_13.632636_2_plen_51_part_00